MDSNHRFFDDDTKYHEYLTNTILFAKWRKELISRNILNIEPRFLLDYNDPIGIEAIEEYGIDEYFAHIITEELINDLSRVYASAVKFTLKYNDVELPKFWSKVLDTKHIPAINLLQSPAFLKWVSN